MACLSVLASSIVAIEFSNFFASICNWPPLPVPAAKPFNWPSKLKLPFVANTCTLPALALPKLLTSTSAPLFTFTLPVLDFKVTLPAFECSWAISNFTELDLAAIFAPLFKFKSPNLAVNASLPEAKLISLATVKLSASMAKLAPNPVCSTDFALANLARFKFWPVIAKFAPVSPVITPVFNCVLATLKLVSPVFATLSASALMVNWL